MEYYQDGTPNFNGYPTEKCERGNPNHRCVSCKITVPQINGRLEGHARDCSWRRKTELEMSRNTDLRIVPSAALWAELQRREAEEDDEPEIGKFHDL